MGKVAEALVAEVVEAAVLVQVAAVVYWEHCWLVESVRQSAMPQEITITPIQQALASDFRAALRFNFRAPDRKVRGFFVGRLAMVSQVLLSILLF